MNISSFNRISSKCDIKAENGLTLCKFHTGDLERGYGQWNLMLTVRGSPNPLPFCLIFCLKSLKFLVNAVFDIPKIWTQMLWPPLFKCCGSAPVSSWILCLPQSRNSTGEEPGGLIPPPLPTLYCNWHSRSVLLHVGLFTLKVIFLCNLFLDFLHILTSCELSKIICSREEIDSLAISWKGEIKGVKGELALALFFSWFLFPKIKIPRK